MMPKRVLIAHTDVAPDGDPSMADVLDEVCCVEKGLEEMSVPFKTVPVAAGRAWEALKPEDDDIVFNLLEAPPGRPLLQIAAAGVLELLGVPYTGCRLASLVLTTDKLSTRALLASEGIAVAPGGRFDPEDPRLLDRVPPPWILKAGFEDASVGLDGEPVVRTREAAVARGRQLVERFPGQPIVLEHYLPGREFNVGVVEVDGAPVILPVAEMTFIDYPDDMPRIVGWEAKWIEGHFSYDQTERAFTDELEEPELVATIREITRRCWAITGASGYARIDLRVDEAGVPCVLEVNANPCISEGSGLMVAAVRAGFSVGSVIASVLQAAQRAHQASDHQLAVQST
jgi:D-alanine-D-alanine ligase